MQDRKQLVFERGLERVDVADLFARDAAAHLVENIDGRLDADVGGDERLFEFVEQLGVDDLAPLEDRVDLLGERLARGLDGAAEARGESLFERRLFGLQLFQRAVEAEHRSLERRADGRDLAAAAFAVSAAPSSVGLASAFVFDSAGDGRGLSTTSLLSVSVSPDSRAGCGVGGAPVGTGSMAGVLMAVVVRADLDRAAGGSSAVAAAVSAAEVSSAVGSVAGLSRPSVM